MANTLALVDEINAKIKELPAEAHALLNVITPWWHSHWAQAVIFGAGGLFGFGIKWMIG